MDANFGMRPLFGTTNLTTAGTAVQLRSDSTGRVAIFQATNRAGGTGNVYLGGDSAVSSASGYRISSGGVWPPNGPLYFNATRVSPSQFWMNSSTTTAKLDHFMLVEP